MKSKEKIEVGVTVILIIIFCFLFFWTVFKKNNSQPLLKGIPSPPLNLVIYNPQSVKNLYKTLEEEILNQEIPRDPFYKVPVIASDETPKLILYGIAWDENKPTAMINNEIVEEGSTILGYSVVAIKEDRVILLDNENKILELVIGP